MTRFNYCLQVVLDSEGGFADHKADKGGRTNYGVTQKTYDNYRDAKQLLKQDVMFIALQEVKEIYYVYWTSAKCDMLQAPLDLMVFDCAINSGAGRATKLLQRALGIPDDGVFGSATLAAVGSKDAKELSKAYLKERSDYYDRIVAKDPSQQVFLKGWKNRLKKLEVITNANQ